ncbi:MAG: Hydrolase, alpha/beta fold family, partial [uncultured Acetobacteraceae bacterium]
GRNDKQQGVRRRAGRQGRGARPGARPRRQHEHLVPASAGAQARPAARRLRPGRLRTDAGARRHLARRPCRGPARRGAGRRRRGARPPRRALARHDRLPALRGRAPGVGGEPRAGRPVPAAAGGRARGVARPGGEGAFGRDARHRRRRRGGRHGGRHEGEPARRHRLRAGKPDGAAAGGLRAQLRGAGGGVRRGPVPHRVPDAARHRRPGPHGAAGRRPRDGERDPERRIPDAHGVRALGDGRAGQAAELRADPVLRPPEPAAPGPHARAPRGGGDAGLLAV